MKHKSVILFIVGQLMNDEYSDDKEMVDHLACESGLDVGKIERLVKFERSRFLQDRWIDERLAVAVVKKYLA